MKIKELKKSGTEADLVISDIDTNQAEWHKRAHDFKAAVRTLQMCTDALKRGYRFDDELASAKIAALEKSTAAIARELPFMSELLDKLGS